MVDADPPPHGDDVAAPRMSPRMKELFDKSTLSLERLHNALQAQIQATGKASGQTMFANAIVLQWPCVRHVWYGVALSEEAIHPEGATPRQRRLLAQQYRELAFALLKFNTFASVESGWCPEMSQALAYSVEVSAEGFHFAVSRAAELAPEGKPLPDLVSRPRR